eukprot:2839333-Pyramimonas_sp.AAC.1
MSPGAGPSSAPALYARETFEHEQFTDASAGPRKPRFSILFASLLYIFADRHDGGDMFVPTTNSANRADRPTARQKDVPRSTRCQAARPLGGQKAWRVRDLWINQCRRWYYCARLCEIR